MHIKIQGLGFDMLKATCFFFYKHIKLQGLGSDILKATQNIG